MKKIFFLIALFPFQAFAIATPVTPVISTTVGCPAGANNCTVPISTSNPLPVTIAIGG